MNFLNRIFLSLIRFYQRAISPLLPARCKYLPTCSQYATECFQTLPFYKALFYSSKRILSCNPWSQGRYDPVPDHSKQHQH